MFGCVLPLTVSTSGRPSLDRVDEWPAEARTAVAKHADGGEQRLGVACWETLCPLLALRMELDRPLASGHGDNDIIIVAQRRLPKILPKKRSETRGDNGAAAVRESPGNGIRVRRAET